MKKKYLIINIFLITALSILTITLGTRLLYLKTLNNKSIDIVYKDINPPEIKPNIKMPETKDILISAIGDCTLGTDDNFGYYKSFTNVLDDHNRDFNYFFSGVKSILAHDDLTIANLETTFTDATVKNPKKFNFKGDYDYSNILINGSIEAVNLANNHTFDYLEKGYKDTINSLNDHKITHFGYEDYKILEIKGIKIGLIGLTGWNPKETQNNTSKGIKYLKENGAELIIVSYHWGIEYEYNQNYNQKSIAHHAIDAGADLVLGHHPHILQGIEKYNGKYIVYSLGNFVFGGNKNPRDKDTMIFQQNFHFVDNILTETNINIIPASLSGLKNWNDFRPIIAEDNEKSRIMNKIYQYSTLE